MEQIIAYLKEVYHPLGILLYGSYADGSHQPGSDFDAIVIVAEGEARLHDVGFVDGIQLDVFVYPETCFQGDFDCETFLGIYDGQILLDTRDIAKQAKERVRAWFDRSWKKSPEEIAANVSWCHKMLLRSQRGDAEGMFRWHWVLVDSLEFICDLLKHPYFGPKKSLRWLQANHRAIYDVYENALRTPTAEALERWVELIEQTYQKNF